MSIVGEEGGVDGARGPVRVLWLSSVPYENTETASEIR